MSKGKIVLIAALLIIAGLVFYIGPEKYFNLDFIKSRVDAFIAYKQANPVTTALIFAGIYIFSTAASIPGALILTLCAGAIFGFVLGTAIALISATIGATLAFLVARYLLDDWVRNNMGNRVAKIRQRFREEGALYLFSLRLVPVFPFFVINLVMALTSIRTSTFFLASLVGMAPGSMVFVNAGTQLSRLDSVKGLLSPALIISFLILAIFPYIAKFLLKQIRARMV